MDTLSESTVQRNNCSVDGAHLHCKINVPLQCRQDCLYYYERREHRWVSISLYLLRLLL